MQKKIISIIIIFLLYSLNVFGDAGEASCMFLRIPVGAKAAALANTLSSEVDDVNSLFYNPAGLGKVKHSEIGLYHNDYLLDMKLNSIGYVHYISGIKGSIGFFTGIFDAGEFENTLITSGVTFEKLGMYSVKEWVAGLGFGRQFSKNVNMGIVTKIINSKLDNVSAKTFAVDMGITYKALLDDDIYNLSLVIQNLGKDIKYDNESSKLPFVLKVGASSSIDIEKFWKLIVSVEGMYGIGNKFEAGIGSEFIYNKYLMLRFGYNRINETDNGLTMGAGVKINKVTADYAYTPFGKIGDTHRISIQFKF